MADLSIPALAGLVVGAISIILMVASAFTHNTCFFLKERTKKKCFYIWLYVFCFVLTCSMTVNLANGYGQGGAQANPLGFPIFFCFVFFLARPIVLWYWKVNAHIEYTKNITEQNKIIITLLERIAKSNEQQSQFFERVSSRQKN